MKIQSVRGTHDILPGSVESWQRIEATARRLFALYGYGEVRTPLLEETELFERSIGSETEMVRKEMYTFSDSKGKTISLRPEGTAPVVRAYIEHGLHRQGTIHKLYYIGPMFRHERPQRGRYRQFHQIAAEVLGSESPALEAEVIEMLGRFLSQVGISQFRLLINSVGCSVCRPPYVELLQKTLRRQEKELCRECRRRIESNPLRVLDCKNASCQPMLDQLPVILDSLCEECKNHFEKFCSYLNLQKIPYELAPRLVRGLDYYVRTTFEIVTDRLGPTQNALLGGGRYDGLAEILEGPPTKGFGFALGMERFLLLLSKGQDFTSRYLPPRPQIFLAYLDVDALQESLHLAGQLRRQGIFAYLDFEERSLKAQLRLAHRLKAHFVCIVGEAEARTGEFPVKRMSDGVQQTLSREEIAQYVRAERAGE